MHDKNGTAAVFLFCFPLFGFRRLNKVSPRSHLAIKIKTFIRDIQGGPTFGQVNETMCIFYMS